MKFSDFLQSYKHAVCLDDPQFKAKFVKKERRADFLLFDGKIICEVKTVVNIDVPAKIESLRNLDNQSEFEQKFFRPVRSSCRNANKQIKQTKDALAFHTAFGLLVLENTIPNNYSSLPLIATALNKMSYELPSIDAVLCIDLINAIEDQFGNMAKHAAIVHREAIDAQQPFHSMLDQIMQDFEKAYGGPVVGGYDVKRADQKWLTDQHGKYVGYKATIDFNNPLPVIKNTMPTKF